MMNETIDPKVAEAVKQLDAIDGNDPEDAHAYADDVLWDHAHPLIQAAYRRVQARCAGRWWYA